MHERKLEDIQRELNNHEHELEQMASLRPKNGAEITLALRKVQEAILYVTKAIEKR